MNSNRITDQNHAVELGGGVNGAIVRAKFYNELKADWDAANPSDGVLTVNTVNEKATGGGVTIEGIQLIDDGISPTANVMQKTVLTTLTADTIVGTSAGDVGHADGAILVAAPGAGYTLEFVSAFLVYDYATDAYTGGADDAVIQVGVTGTQVAVTSAITGASLLEAAADKMLRLGSTATELVHADNGAISLYGTALTQPGTAAGVLRCYVTYNVITTGL